MVPSTGPSIIAGSMEMLCWVHSSVRLWRPIVKGLSLSSLHLLDLEVCEALDETLDEALDDVLDAHEDSRSFSSILLKYWFCSILCFTEILY